MRRSIWTACARVVEQHKVPILCKWGSTAADPHAPLVWVKQCPFPHTGRCRWLFRVDFQKFFKAAWWLFAPKVTSGTRIRFFLISIKVWSLKFEGKVSKFEKCKRCIIAICWRCLEYIPSADNRACEQYLELCKLFFFFFLQRESFLFVTDGLWLPIQPSARCSRPNDYARQINVNKLRSFIFEQVPVLISVARIELRDIKKWSDNAQFLLLRLTLSHNLIFSPQRAGFSISILIHELMDLGSLKQKDIKEDNINLGWDIRTRTKMLGQELNVLVAKEAI